MTVSRPSPPHPPGQVAHEGARRVANRGRAHRALQHGGEEGAEELVRDDPQLLFALLRFLCRPGRWSTRLKLQRPPEGSAQVDGNVAKIDLAARGVDGLVHFNAPSWAVRAVMSSNTLPVCPKTGSTSPSLTVHLCLHTALLREIGNAPVVESIRICRVRGFLPDCCCPSSFRASTRLAPSTSTSGPRIEPWRQPRFAIASPLIRWSRSTAPAIFEEPRSWRAVVFAARHRALRSRGFADAPRAPFFAWTPNRRVPGTVRWRG